MNVLAGFELSDELDLHDLGKVKESSLVVFAAICNVLSDIGHVNDLLVGVLGVQVALSGGRVGVGLHLTHHTGVEAGSILTNDQTVFLKFGLTLSEFRMIEHLSISEFSCDVRNLKFANGKECVEGHSMSCSYLQNLILLSNLLETI